MSLLYSIGGRPWKQNDWTPSCDQHCIVRTPVCYPTLPVKLCINADDRWYHVETLTGLSTVRAYGEQVIPSLRPPSHRFTDLLSSLDSYTTQIKVLIWKIARTTYLFPSNDGSACAWIFSEISWFSGSACSLLVSERLWTQERSVLCYPIHWAVSGLQNFLFSSGFWQMLVVPVTQVVCKFWSSCSLFAWK